jgi:hypothetical protein
VEAPARHSRSGRRDPIAQEVSRRPWPRGEEVAMHRSLALPVLALLLASSARGETTLSTSSFLPGSTQSVWCILTNVGKKPVTVTIDHVDINAVVLGTGSLEIFPQNSDARTMVVAGTVRCRFTGQFSRKSVRAAALLIDGGTVLSVPAQ